MKQTVTTWSQLPRLLPIVLCAHHEASEPGLVQALPGGPSCLR